MRYLKALKTFRKPVDSKDWRYEDVDILKDREIMIRKKKAQDKLSRLRMIKMIAQMR
jgi:hypothetical protein